MRASAEDAGRGSGVKRGGERVTDWKQRPFWRLIWPSMIGVATGLIASDLSTMGAIGAHLLMFLVILFIYYR